MIHAIIADDEKNAINEMLYIINWEKEGIIIDALAENGEQAILYIKKYSPDIIFCDINMPKKNGIEVLKYIKSANLKTIFVAISAYSEFDYVKQCLSNGAFDYLMKTVDRAELIKIIDKIKNNIYDIEMQKQKIDSIKLLINLMDNNDVTNDLSNLKFNFKYNFFSIVFTESTNFPVEQQNTYNEFNFLPINYNGKNIFFCNFNDKNIFLKFINTFQKCSVSKISTNTKKLYKQADIAFSSIKFFNKNTIYYKNYNLKAVNEVIDFIKNSDNQNLIKAKILTYLHSTQELATLYNSCLDLTQENQMTYQDIAYNFNNLDELIKAVLPTNNDTIQKSSSSDILLDQIISYINLNYNKDISIIFLSKKFFISSSYLNFIFKKKFDTTINKYIINLRMKKSLELLSTEKYTLIEISQLIGYNDFYYFSRLFKKTFNKSPSYYKHKD